MANKKALTDEELFAQFEDIPSATPTAASNTSSRTAVKPAKATADSPANDDDPLAELSALAAARPVSRPSTPRLSSSTTSGTGRKVETPVSSGPPSGRTSEDRLRTTGNVTGRKSTESMRSFHQSQTPAESTTPEASHKYSLPQVRAQEAPAPPAGSGGGWWGSVFTAASAAVKQAEAAVKEIRGNEEAMKWAEQVKGNVESLKGFGKTHHFLIPSVFIFGTILMLQRRR